MAGPTTLLALLNSLQMGFRTLAIEKRSGEVWRLLSQVKGDFTAFGDTHWEDPDAPAPGQMSPMTWPPGKPEVITRRLRSVESLEEPRCADASD